MTVLVEFESPVEARAALRRLTSLGYLDCRTYSPFPLTEEDARAPRGSFPLSFFAFAGGVTALILAYLIQWYANARSYPLNIGGRPAHAATAFIPSVFESVCLLATVALVAGFLLLERLPRLWQPILEVEEFERSSVDRFWIAIEAGSAREDRVLKDVMPLGPARVVVNAS